MPNLVRVEFGIHVPKNSVASMVTGLGVYGLVSCDDGNTRQYVVDVFRASKLPKLTTELVKLEGHGFLTWTAIEQA